MKNVLLITLLATAAARLELAAQDAKAAVEAASAAVGATNLQAVQYTGTGSTYGFGQAVSPGGPWPRFTLTSYVARINYSAPAAREEMARIDDENPPRGGGAGPYNPATGQGGIRPIPFGAETQVRQPSARTDQGLVQIWMTTPHGFLKAAAQAPSVTMTSTNTGGRRTRTISFARGVYTVTGAINDDNLVERVEARLYNNVVGDMLVESIFSDYRDFGGIRFPTRIVQRQAGHPTLDLRITSVEPNAAAAAALTLPAANQQAGPPQPPRIEAQRVEDGVWFLSGGAPMSYLIEFSDHLVIVEAPGNDARSEGALAEAKRVVPGKPVRYLVNSHNHFDHAGGLRGFVADGVTIITHELNKPYYERLFTSPHTLNPDRLARVGRTAKIETVGDKRVLSDGARTVELHHVRGNLHDPAMLMVYLPKEKILMQADAFNPRPADARPLPGPSPYTVNLLENIERLKLDVAQIAHIHGGVDAFEALVKAARPK